MAEWPKRAFDMDGSEFLIPVVPASQLAAAREELEAAQERLKGPLIYGSEAIKAQAAEAALERVREWAEDAATKQYPLGYQAKHVLSLIEHGPDDGKEGDADASGPRISRRDVIGGAIQSSTGGPAEPDDVEEWLAKQMKHGWADATDLAQLWVLLHPEPDDGESEQKGCICDAELLRLDPYVWADPDCPVHGESEQK